MKNSGKHALLIEETPDHLELIQAALDLTGISCSLHLIQDIHAVRDFLAGRGENLVTPDVIILAFADDNLEILRSIRNNILTASIPIVFISPDSRQDVESAYNLGANSVITRPVSAEKMAEFSNLFVSYWLHWNVPPPH